MNINLVPGALNIVYTSHPVLWLEGLKVLDLWTLLIQYKLRRLGLKRFDQKYTIPCCDIKYKVLEIMFIHQ